VALRDTRHAGGWLFGAVLRARRLERFVVEYFRANDDRFFGVLTTAQVIALGPVSACGDALGAGPGHGDRDPRGARAA
jgi:prolipoprotein diacylglyceryltransferase